MVTVWCGGGCVVWWLCSVVIVWWWLCSVVVVVWWWLCSVVVVKCGERVYVVEGGGCVVWRESVCSGGGWRCTCNEENEVKDVEEGRVRK